jgi:hypothetical protein
VSGNRVERGEGREDGKQEKEREEGEGKGYVQSSYENCIFPRHTWGECGTHSGDEFLQVLPGFACIVRYRDFL